MMFHVDKLPLDQDRMREVANDLVILASRNAQGNQRRLNINAKLLAIAIRLDSKNPEAKKLNTKFSNNEQIIEANPDRYKHSLQRTLNLIGILSRAEKHAEAHTFANFLKDALQEIAGDHPAIKNHQLNKQRWKNVLAVVKDSPPSRPKPKENPEENMPEKKDPVVENPGDTTDPAENPEIDKNLPVKWNFLTAEITTPVILNKKVNDSIKHYWSVTNFNLTWKPIPGEKGTIKVKIRPDLDEAKTKGLEDGISNMLRKRWKEFPSAEVKIYLPEAYDHRSGKLGLLPIVTQLYASLNNTVIPQGVQMIGEPDGSGNISSSSLIWTQLKELRKEKGLKQILFCPADLEQGLTQLVTLEEAEFFVRNEVILVKSIDEVTQYFGGVSDADKKLAHEKFVAIRDVVGSRSVGSFSVDKKIRVSLEEIVTLNPNHVSAKMILLRGDTKRSTKLDPYFVAEEFKSLIGSLKWIYDKDSAHLNSEAMAEYADTIDQQLETVERYIDSSESDMKEALEEMSDELNNMSRTLKKKDSDYHKRSTRIAHDRFREHYNVATKFIKENQPDNK